MRRWLLWACAFLLPVAMMANDQKLAPELRHSASPTPVPVIVQYKTHPGETPKSRIRAANGAVRRELQTIRGLAAQMPANALATLSEDDNVAYISPDRPVRSNMNNAAGAVLADYAWGLGYDGSGRTRFGS